MRARLKVADIAGCGLAVGVPGVPAAIDRLLREEGTYSLAQAVAPAVSRARQGEPTPYPAALAQRPGGHGRAVETGLTRLAAHRRAACVNMRVPAGFPMYEHLHRRIRGAANRLARSEAGSKLYLDALRQGPRVAIGETFSNPDLAATLEHLADKVRA